MPTKSFRPWLPDHPTLLPTDVRRWLPEDHLAWFVLDIVPRLDFTRIEARIHAKDPRGAPPYDPRMMSALLMYGYAVGVFSSRRIERATYEDVAFRVLAGDQHPDHDTIATFRRDHLDDFHDLFVQVLRLAGTMGLVSFGVLGLDGVKILANASKHQAMSHDRMKKEIGRLKDEIATLVARAEQTDGEEQARFGDGRVADLPAEIARREARLSKIEQALSALEAEATEARLAELRAQAEHHETRAADADLTATDRKRAGTLGRQRRATLDAMGDGSRPDDDDDDPDPDGDLPSHQVPHQLDGAPKDSAQRNFTDPDSRIMVRDGDHVVQAFNAQALVDNAHQIIVSAAVGNQAPDAEYFAPMLDRADQNLAAAGIAKPSSVPTAADAGYFSEQNVRAAEERGYDPYIAPDRSKHARSVLPAVAATPTVPNTGPPPPASGSTALTPKQKMRAKLDTPEGSRIYGLRKTTPEPVFGQIPQARGFRRFMLRGLQKVRGEWSLVTLTHNLLKLWRSGRELPLPA